MKQQLAVATLMACALSAHAQLTPYVAPHGDHQWWQVWDGQGWVSEYQEGELILARQPPVHIPAVPETNPAPVLGALLVIGAAWQLRHRLVKA